MRVWATAAVLMAIGSAPAAAQSPVYGGGALPYPKATYASLGVTLQPRGDRIAVRFDTGLLCGRSVYDIVGRRIVAWDGRSFTAAAARTLPIGARGSHARVDFRWTISGQADGATAAGTVRVSGVRHIGRRTTSCNHRTVRGFSARLVAPAATGAPTPPGGAAFAGVSTISVADGLPGAVLVKATRDGSKVYARWTALASCGKGPRVSLLNITPAATVQADGSFSHPERFSVRYADALIRYHALFSGRISGESANGALRLRARVYDRRGKKLVTTCDTKPRTWTAGLVRAPAPAPAGTTSTPGSSSSSQAPPQVVPGAWSLNMTSDSGDYIGQGHPWSHGPPGDTLRVSATRQGVSFAIDTRDPDNGGQYGWWTTDFAAPSGQDLAVGTTYQAKRYPFNDNAAGFDHSGMGRGCNTLTATFTIQDLAFDPNGALRTFHATFEQHCEGMTPALRGTWDFHAA